MQNNQQAHDEFNILSLAVRDLIPRSIAISHASYIRVNGNIRNSVHVLLYFVRLW